MASACPAMFLSKGVFVPTDRAAGGKATPGREVFNNILFVFISGRRRKCYTPGHNIATGKCFVSKYRAAGGNATPGRSAATLDVCFQNIGPPEAMPHLGAMLLTRMCLSQYRAAGGNATPGRNVVGKCVFPNNIGSPEAMVRPDDMH